jgi:hypothetical protein
MRRRNLLIVAFVVLLVGVLGFKFLSKIRYVDPKPALALGDDYFSDLRQGQVDDAFQKYTNGFLNKVGKEWRNVIAQLDGEGGTVTDFKLIGYHVVPVTLQDQSEIPRVLVRYQITRKSVSSDENLIVCPYQRGAAWAIAGHEISRKDTGQHFSAGITVTEKVIVGTN